MGFLTRTDCGQDLYQSPTPKDFAFEFQPVKVRPEQPSCSVALINSSQSALASNCHFNPQQYIILVLTHSGGGDLLSSRQRPHLNPSLLSSHELVYTIVQEIADLFSRAHHSFSLWKPGPPSPLSRRAAAAVAASC